MENLAKYKQEVLRNMYNLLFNELSKLQIEQKFLERQAQSLVENLLRRSSDPEIKEKINAIIEENDQDLEIIDDDSLKFQLPEDFAYKGDLSG